MAKPQFTPRRLFSLLRDFLPRDTHYTILGNVALLCFGNSGRGTAFIARTSWDVSLLRHIIIVARFVCLLCRGSIKHRHGHFWGGLCSLQLL